MKTVTSAQVHRFGDHVAIWLGDGQTVYLSPSQATAIAKVLTDCTADIAERPFIKSTFGTWRLQNEVALS